MNRAYYGNLGRLPSNIKESVRRSLIASPVDNFNFFFHSEEAKKIHLVKNTDNKNGEGNTSESYMGSILISKIPLFKNYLKNIIEMYIGIIVTCSRERIELEMEMKYKERNVINKMRIDRI